MSETLPLTLVLCLRAQAHRSHLCMCKTQDPYHPMVLAQAPVGSLRPHSIPDLPPRRPAIVPLTWAQAQQQEQRQSDQGQDGGPRGVGGHGCSERAGGRRAPRAAALEDWARLDRGAGRRALPTFQPGRDLPAGHRANGPRAKRSLGAPPSPAPRPPYPRHTVTPAAAPLGRRPSAPRPRTRAMPGPPTAAGVRGRDGEMDYPVPAQVSLPPSPLGPAWLAHCSLSPLSPPR